MSICHPDVSIPTLNEGMVDYKLFTNCSIKEIINIYLEKNDNHNAFFLIDIRQITKLYGLLNEYLPNIKPYYAVKCNPDPNFITILFID